jgi:hypothetical protein
MRCGLNCNRGLKIAAKTGKNYALSATYSIVTIGHRDNARSYRPIDIHLQAALLGFSIAVSGAE